MKNCDVAVIGAGPAGLAAAIEARKNGAQKVIIIERNNEAGGILPQCIHNGFGSVLFKKDLPGPRYAHEFIKQARELGVEMIFDTMAIDITPNRKIYATNSRDGLLEIDSKSIVLAMGCRERTRAQIRIPGDRPAGVYTAGMVQRLVNMEGMLPGRKFVILGSGDIGMIMARRLVLEGAKVIKVLEALPYLTGLRRNYVQCLQDFDIPLSLGTTVKRIIGKKRLNAIETVKLDEKMTPAAGTEEIIECDTLMLSVGLIPENELSKKAGVLLDPLTGGPVVDCDMQTSVPGIFACGNVVTIYDLVDYVSKAGFIAGKSAAMFTAKNTESGGTIDIIPGDNVRSVIPQKLKTSGLLESVSLQFRVSREFNKSIAIYIKENGRIVKKSVRKYARPAEMLEITIEEKELKGINGQMQVQVAPND